MKCTCVNGFCIKCTGNSVNKIYICRCLDGSCNTCIEKSKIAIGILNSSKYRCRCINWSETRGCAGCAPIKDDKVMSIKIPATSIAHDTVSHPKHYNSSQARCECGRRLECIDVVRYLSFNLGNAIKYLWRFEHKNGLEDLKKARWYLDDEIKRREDEQHS